MTATDNTWEAFMRASLPDDDLGYPDDVTFVPVDAEWADKAINDMLLEGRTVVLALDGVELLISPDAASFIDRLMSRFVHRISVNVRLIDRAHETPRYALHSTLGREPLRQMRELALNGRY